MEKFHYAMEKVHYPNESSRYPWALIEYSNALDQGLLFTTLNYDSLWEQPLEMVICLVLREIEKSTLEIFIICQLTMVMES